MEFVVYINLRISDGYLKYVELADRTFDRTVRGIILVTVGSVNYSV